jgi:Protein of unknown function (DUF2877)
MGRERNVRPVAAGVGVPDEVLAEVVSVSPGVAWLRSTDGPVHLTGPRGPLGPLTVIADPLPHLGLGDLAHIVLARAERRPTPPWPPPADPDALGAALAWARPSAWRDPRLDGLRPGHAVEAAPALAGSGPGLTPSGDDALAGYLLARRAAGNGADGSEAREVLTVVVARSGEPSLSLVRWAARGETFDVAAAVLRALLRGEPDAPSLSRLLALGGETGRAMLAGMIAGLEPVAGGR